jgi:hypothetical protein
MIQSCSGKKDSDRISPFASSHILDLLGDGIPIDPCKSACTNGLGGLKRPGMKVGIGRGCGCIDVCRACHVGVLSGIASWAAQMNHRPVLRADSRPTKKTGREKGLGKDRKGMYYSGLATTGA